MTMKKFSILLTTNHRKVFHKNLCGFGGKLPLFEDYNPVILII